MEEETLFSESLSRTGRHRTENGEWVTKGIERIDDREWSAMRLTKTNANVMLRETRT